MPEPTIDEKLDTITEELGKLTLPSDDYVHNQISQILEAVRDGDNSVLEVVAKTDEKVGILNGRLFDIEKWRERLTGAAGLFAFLITGGVVASAIILFVQG